MMTDSRPAVSPLAMAGLLLCARSHLRRLGLSHPDVGEILEATQVGRSRAFEISRQVEGLLENLVRPRGRPRGPETTSAPDESAALTQGVLQFVMDHPGCVTGGVARRRYSDLFRLHIIELHAQHPSIDLKTLAEAVGIPLGTLEDWLRPGCPLDGEQPHDEPTLDPERTTRQTKIETVLYEWSRWHGDFTSFSRHVRDHFHIDFGITMIGSILAGYGKRRPQRRPGRSPDEEALRKSFETFFPGAQWVGDGTSLTVTVDHQRFDFNFELFVDASSDAHVGLSVRDEEDSQAVVDAFQNGVETTNSPPLAVLLDNRPSNHTEQVDNALDDALNIPSTEGRAQNKAHVEGAFGLFKQTAPPLEVTTSTPYEIARQIALLVLVIYCRAINGRPRRDRDGKSRLDLYQAPVSPEERNRVKEALLERQRKQQEARRTREARLDPARREILDRGFERLHLLDPERHFRNAIARYPLDDIVDAIAIFSGKRDAATLPKDVDARYLLGIVRNVHHVHEAEAVTEALLRERLRARDLSLEPLVRERDLLDRQKPDGDAVMIFVDNALETDRTLDRFFWLTAAADAIRRQPHPQRESFFRSAARRIHATFRVKAAQRDAAERFLLRRVWPLE